jgi:hypothetical protein
MLISPKKNRYRTLLLKAQFSYHEWHKFANITNSSPKSGKIRAIRPACPASCAALGFVRFVIEKCPVVKNKPDYTDSVALSGVTDFSCQSV